MPVTYFMFLLYRFGLCYSIYMICNINNQTQKRTKNTHRRNSWNLFLETIKMETKYFLTVCLFWLNTMCGVFVHKKINVVWSTMIISWEIFAFDRFVYAALTVNRWEAIWKPFQRIKIVNIVSIEISFWAFRCQSNTHCCDRLVAS